MTMSDDLDPCALRERILLRDRLSTLEHVVSHLAHQLGTPLNVIEGRATMLGSPTAERSDVERHARIIAEQSARMVRMLREAVAFCRRAAPPTERVEVLALVTRALATFGPLAREKGVEVSLESAPSGAAVQGDSDALSVALMHLLESGIRATPAGGTLHVRVRTERGTDADGAAARFVCVDVEDGGPGLEDVVPTENFKPFATTLGGRDASGVGLFVADRIVKQHGGSLHAENKPDRGALFSLRLPEGVIHAE